MTAASNRGRNAAQQALQLREGGSTASQHRYLLLLESQNHSGWKRPLRSSSPTVAPTPPCLLNRVLKCHFVIFVIFPGVNFQTHLQRVRTTPPTSTEAKQAGCEAPTSPTDSPKTFHSPQATSSCVQPSTARPERHRSTAAFPRTRSGHKSCSAVRTARAPGQHSDVAIDPWPGSYRFPPGQGRARSCPPGTKPDATRPGALASPRK